jgi:hypothetical protein
MRPVSLRDDRRRLGEPLDIELCINQFLKLTMHGKIRVEEPDIEGWVATIKELARLEERHIDMLVQRTRRRAHGTAEVWVVGCEANEAVFAPSYAPPVAVDYSDLEFDPTFDYTPFLDDFAELRATGEIRYGSAAEYEHWCQRLGQLATRDGLRLSFSVFRADNLWGYHDATATLLAPEPVRIDCSSCGHRAPVATEGDGTICRWCAETAASNARDYTSVIEAYRELCARGALTSSALSPEAGAEWTTRIRELAALDGIEIRVEDTVDPARGTVTVRVSVV